MPNLDGTTSTGVSYSKPHANISYEEFAQGQGKTIYIFRITSDENP
jgi:hypothetical protein